jgi:hypothetical protein
MLGERNGRKQQREREEEGFGESLHCFSPVMVFYRESPKAPVLIPSGETSGAHAPPGLIVP